MVEKELVERIDRWIEGHRDEFIEDVVRMVRIKSVAQQDSPVKPYGSGCREALHAMLDLGKKHGFLTENYEEYMGSIDMGIPKETIGFWGHLDVVPEGDGWDFPPYEGVVKNGMIIGRGAQDNKGQTMEVFYVMRCIQELGIPLRHNLKLFLGTDEERGMSDIQYYLDHYSAPPFSIIADSNYPVCYGEKGIITAELISEGAVSGDILRLEGGTADNVVPDAALAELKKTERVIKALPALREMFTITETENTVLIQAKGSAGHTAFPQNSVNAVGLLTRGLCESKALSEEDESLLEMANIVNADCYGEALGAACQDEDSGRMTCVGSILRLDQRRVAVTINIRYPITCDGEGIVENVKKACNRLACQMQLKKLDPAHRFPLDHPVVKILTDTYNRVMGDNKEPFVLPGGTYSRKLPNSISYGMGFSGDISKFVQVDRGIFREGHGGAHGPDESTIIELLLRSIKIYVLGLLAIDHLQFQEAEY